jgi:glycosyltransferase involved in cell wall biosynthesis
MSQSKAIGSVVYLCVWSGEAEPARELVRSRYPAARIEEFPHRKLRVSRSMQRIRLLRGLRGQAVIFYFESLDAFRHKQIVECLHFLHRCQETALCDQSRRWESIGNTALLRSIPGVLSNLWLDVWTLVKWWVYLQMWPTPVPAIPRTDVGCPEVAYLIPSPASMGAGGGAISHIRGFLYSLESAGKSCRVFTGTPLAQNAFDNELVVAETRPYFFWGAVMLAYNWAFVRGVQTYLSSDVPGVFYQRHFAFSIAGALLSRRLKVPLILEYNGSEVWLASHWDPKPLRSWIRLCEMVALRSATRIVVVSKALRDELIQRGIQADRVRVNPNAVDSGFFYPGRGGGRARRELGVENDEVLIGFVGSFSFWHGIEVLQRAIVNLLDREQPCRLRFILVGDGLLHGEMRSALAAYEKTGAVIFTGLVSRERVADYLDAADILVSPHVPMPDGSRFFGSPTKLFEYMAMGKGIVASRLEQLAEVLEHDHTAWLVKPGDSKELAEGILRLALDPKKRAALGAAARRVAVERHSWSQNMACALDDMLVSPSQIERPAVEQDRSVLNSL